MKPIQAILFDLDGVLIDSEPIGMRGLDIYLGRYGHQVPPGFASQLIGRRSQDNARLLIDHFGLPLDAETVIAEHREVVFAMVVSEVEPMPGVRELLAVARELGLRTAVATSSPRPYLHMILDKFGWQRDFDATVTGEEVAHGKPAPDIFLRAAELVGAPPAACLVVEDAPHGVAAGLAAGATVLAVPNSVTRELLFPAEARKVESLHAVAAWLKGA